MQLGVEQSVPSRSSEPWDFGTSVSGPHLAVCRGMRCKHLLSTLCALALLSVADHPAQAEPPATSSPGSGTAGTKSPEEEADPVMEAKRRYAAGTRAMQQRQYAEAALHFEAAQAAAPSGVSLLGSALAWDAAGQPQRAADAYARALEEPGMSKSQTSHAAARLNALEPSLGTLVVSGEAGMRVQLDDNVDSGLPARLHGAPGTHRLTVWAKGKIAGRREVYLRLGRPETIVVPWTEEATPAPPPQRTVVVQTSSSPPPLRLVGAGLLGGGLVASAAALGFTVTANSQRAALPEAGATTGPALGTLAGIAWIGSAVLVGSGVTCLLLPVGERPQSSISVGFSPGGAAVSGSF